MNMFYSIESDYSFEETIDVIKKEISSANFSVLAEINLSEKLRSKNLPMKEELVVLEICNPTYAHDVLNKQQNSKYLLPCRITINSGSNTTVGIINYEVFGSLHYNLSESESYVLNEIKQILSIVKKNTFN
jgi:uncharacterized protein (DUF302 family)